MGNRRFGWPLGWVVVLPAAVLLAAVSCGDDGAGEAATTTTEDAPSTSTLDTTTTADTTTSRPADSGADGVPLSGGEVELTLRPEAVPAVPGPVDVAVEGTVPEGWTELFVMVCPGWRGPRPDGLIDRACGVEAGQQRDLGAGVNVRVSDAGFSTTLTVHVDEDMIDRGGVTILAGDIFIPFGGWETLRIGGADDPSDEPADELARLSGLPWAGPDDAHEDPIAAVEAFVGFVADTHLGDPSAPVVEVVIGEFAAGDQRSGEVEVTFGEPASTGGGTTEATTTVFVRRSGPDDTWWVLGSASSTLTVTEPEPDAAIESPLEVAGSNAIMSDAVEMRIWANGDDTPLVETFVTGGGVFALGEFSFIVGTETCLTFQNEPCDPTGPAGGHGTVVFTTSWAVTTVPIVFAGP